MSGALVMVAPNGGRRGKADHPEVPVTVAEIAETARRCCEAGAGAIHLHVRDRDGRHVLDAGLYREASAAVRAATGGRMPVQITTEAVGRYGPPEQMAVVRAVRPAAASVALRELAPGPADEAKLAGFYGWAREAGVGLQHILYSPDEAHRLAGLIARRVVPGERHAVLLVLGRHAAGQESDVRDLLAFLEALAASGLAPNSEWMVCAFGRAETAALAAALALGGHARVGFENSLVGPDGAVARDNAGQVARIARIAALLGRADGAGEAALGIGLP